MRKDSYIGVTTIFKIFNESLFLSFFELPVMSSSYDISDPETDNSTLSYEESSCSNSLDSSNDSEAIYESSVSEIEVDKEYNDFSLILESAFTIFEK